MACCVCCGTVRCQIIRFALGIFFAVVYIPGILVALRMGNYDAGIAFGACGLSVAINTYFVWALYGKCIKEALRRRKMGESGEMGMMYPVNKTSGFETGDHTDISPIMEMAYVNVDTWSMRPWNPTIIRAACAVFGLLSLVMSIYYLIMGAFIEKQTWDGESYFLPMVGWLNTLKWSFITIRLFAPANSSTE